MKIFQPQAMFQMGKRTNQEDSIFPKEGNATENDRLFIVCDGMGGHESGEVASNSICQSISDFLKDANPDTFSVEDFKKALEYAYDNLDKLDQNPDNPRKMGTTLTFLYLGNKSAIIAHIGDSRVYQLRRHKKGTVSIVHRTEDHSLVNDLIRAELITEEEAKTHPRRNVITRAIQPNLEERHKATIYETADVREDDYFFLCSDGVLESIDDRILTSILESNSSDEDKIEEIKKRCNENSKDNNSAYLVHIKEGLPFMTKTNTQNVEETKDKSPMALPKDEATKPQVFHQRSSHESQNKHSKLKRARTIGKVIGLVSTLVVVIGIGIGGVIFILNTADNPIAADKELSYEQKNSPFLQDDSIAIINAELDENAPEYFKNLSRDEQFDVIYLKKFNHWNKRDLKSTKYIAIFENLKTGNIEAIVALFNGFGDDHINSYLKNIINRYKTATPTQKEAFKNAVSADSFNIQTAFGALAKITTTDSEQKKNDKKKEDKKEQTKTTQKEPTPEQPKVEGANTQGKQVQQPTGEENKPQAEEPTGEVPKPQEAPKPQEKGQPAL